MLNKSKGSLSIESIIMMPLIFSLIAILYLLIAFNIYSSAVIYITAQSSRYASLASTTTEQEVITYIESQFTSLNIPTTNLTIDINAPGGITSPGDEITTTITIPFNNTLLNILPAQISKSFTAIKEGL